MICTFHAAKDEARAPFITALVGRYLAEQCGRRVTLIDMAWDLPLLHDEFRVRAGTKPQMAYIGSSVPREMVVKRKPRILDPLPRHDRLESGSMQPYWWRGDNGGSLHLMPVHEFKDSYWLDMARPQMDRFRNFLRQSADFVLICDRAGQMTQHGETAVSLSDTVVAITDPALKSAGLIKSFTDDASRQQGLGTSKLVIHQAGSVGQFRAAFGTAAGSPLFVVPDDEDVMAADIAFDNADADILKPVRQMADILTLQAGPDYTPSL